jgi:hypothetical protein
MTFDDLTECRRTWGKSLIYLCVTAPAAFVSDRALVTQAGKDCRSSQER